MLSEDRLYWIWLAEKCGPASKELSKLIGDFENPYEIFRLEPEETVAIEGISDRLKDKLCEKSLERPYSILKYCRQNGVQIITYADSEYPSRLKTLEDPPAVLYCKGRFPDMNKRLCIGVVGTRKISEYGMRTSYKISYELALADICIVSGMARGVDAVASCAAIEAQGVTVAVLGSGIDIVYPKEHVKLMRDICKHGAVITEYPPGEAPYANNFPKRNRIISGLSQGVLIIEGDNSSGAIITAERAISQGREVFALPGNINESNSEGTNALIQKGVNVALKSDDIINHFDFLYSDVIDRTNHYLKKSGSEFRADALINHGVSCEIKYGARQKANSGGNHTNETQMLKTDIRQSESAAPESREEHTDKAPSKAGDNSSAVLATLDAITVKVFEAMPFDRAISADEFISAGISITEAITSLTMLEIYGLVSSLPGGMYMRK